MYLIKIAKVHVLKTFQTHGTFQIHALCNQYS